MAYTEFREILGKYPNVTYRRGQNLRDHLVRSRYEEKREETWLVSQVIGSYSCGNCSFCSYLPKMKESTVPREGKKIQLRQFFNCRSKGIVYVTTCTCPKLYVGKTIQEFRRRISKHLKSMWKGEETPLARHIRNFHQGNFKILKFWGLKQVKMGQRKGNLDKILLKEEAKWIYRLNMLSSNGLNEGFTITPFI